MPAKSKKPHHKGSYHVESERLRRIAWSDPATICWRCGQPLATCGPNRNGRHKNGKPAKWTAGHINNADPDGPMLPECSPCMASSGATYGNRLRGARRAAQKRQRTTQTHTSTRW